MQRQLELMRVIAKAVLDGMATAKWPACALKSSIFPIK
jgi:hypothetical protein